MIRDAAVADWPAVAELGERLIDKTPYAGRAPLDRKAALGVYGMCISSAMGFAMVAERDGEVTGILMAVADQLWFSKARFVSDLVFYVEDGRSGLPLLRAMVEWAWTMPKVIEITCAQSSMIRADKLDALYRRCGFENRGGIWTLQRPNQ